eukprot:TRINITY_DN12494_c0_g1_i1.p1 TRINITY_DN12494_c0_g1~~TRINITY_DN12494_c0_g1_i1.p1  ORF type:complete len:405 (-),score=118.57 TRINITY_DN12494_c0_g1_i1:203-1357(-)
MSGAGGTGGGVRGMGTVGGVTTTITSTAPEWTGEEVEALQCASRLFPASKFKGVERYAKIAELVQTKDIRQVAQRLHSISAVPSTPGPPEGKRLGTPVSVKDGFGKALGEEDSVKKTEDERRGGSDKRSRLTDHGEVGGEAPSAPPGGKSVDPSADQQALLAQLFPSYSGAGIPSSSAGAVSSRPLVIPSSGGPSSSMNESTYVSQSELESVVEHCLQENIRIIGKMRDNLLNAITDPNFDLMTQFRSNISAILASMAQMGGVMGQMAAIPIRLSMILPQSSPGIPGGDGRIAGAMHPSSGMSGVDVGMGGLGSFSRGVPSGGFDPRVAGPDFLSGLSMISSAFPAGHVDGGLQHMPGIPTSSKPEATSSADGSIKEQKKRKGK